MAAKEEAPQPQAEAERVVFVISDSDEESTKEVPKDKADNNTRSLFDEFVTVSNSLLTKIRDDATAEKIKKHLLKVFKSAKQDYISSEEFINTLQHYLTELWKPDIKDQAIFSVVHDVIIHLKNASNKLKKKKWDKANSDTEINKDKNEDAVVVKTEVESDGCGGTEPCGSKDVNTDQPEGEINKDANTSSENASNLPSNANGIAKKSASSKESSISSDGDKPSCSHNDTPEKVDKSKRRKVRRMEKLMGKLDREIRRYSEKELTLEEMERDDSSHMIEHKLRKRFIEAWRKWCKLKGYEAKTGRGIEKKVKYEGTRYPEINLKIRKLVKHNKFPDFHDVYRVIRKTNQSKNLGIHKFDLQPLATEVFRDIGEKLSKRRINDYMDNPGYASLLDAPDDPAGESPELKARLEDNAAKGKLMMDNVLEKYTNMARELHAPGVEPDFDRTSDPEVPPDSSDDEIEGEWIEYDSDSDESQSAEPSVAKIPEEESIKMEMLPVQEAIHENKMEDSKKHHLDVDRLSDNESSEKKRMKLDPAIDVSEEKEKSSATLETIPFSSADAISDSMSKKEVSCSSQGPSNETDSPSSLQILDEADLSISSVGVKKCSVSIPRMKTLPSLPSRPPVPASMKIQPPKISLQPSPQTSTPAKSSVSRKELADVLATMQPVKLVTTGRTNLQRTSDGSSSTGSIKTTSVSRTLQLARPSTTSTTSTNSKAPTRRIQLHSQPLKSLVSSTNSKDVSPKPQFNSGGATRVVALTNSTAQSNRIQLNPRPPVSKVSLTNNLSSRSQPTSLYSVRSTNPHNYKAQTVKMQLTPRPSTGSTSTMNISNRYREQFNAMQACKAMSVKNAPSTNSRSLSARMGSLPSTTTKTGVHPVVNRLVNANGKVKLTRTLVPNERTTCTVAGNQAPAKQVRCLGKTFNGMRHPPVQKSNGAKTTFHEDDDGVIVLD